MLRFVRYHLCKIIKLCKDEVKKMQFVIRYSPDRSKIHEMCKKLFQKFMGCQNLFLTTTKITKCIIKLLIFMHMHQNFSPTAMRLKKNVTKPSILFVLQYSSFLNVIKFNKCVAGLLIFVFLYLTQFLIDIRLNKCVIKAVSEESFMLKNCHDKYKTQEICDEAVGDFLPALKFIPYWFVTNKMIKNFILLYSQMTIYFLFFDEDPRNMKFSYVEICILRSQKVIMLTLMMLILMRIILRLSFMSDMD